MPSPSTNPVVLVTGGSRGIGISTVQYLLQSGLKSAQIPRANVITLSRSLPSELSELQERNKDELECVQGDLLDESIHKKVVDRALDRWGRLDALVLNAGVIEFGRVADAEVSQVGWGRERLDIDLLLGDASLFAAPPTAIVYSQANFNQPHVAVYDAALCAEATACLADGSGPCRHRFFGRSRWQLCFVGRVQRQ